MDKNSCTFIGRIGSPIKTSVTQNGDPYCWFLLEIESRVTQNSTENNRYQKINIMCFRSKVIKYLQRLNAREGNYVIVFGFVSSFPTEVKGQRLIANGINANEVYLIKT